MIDNVVLVSIVCQSDSFIYTLYIYILFHIFSIMVYYRILNIVPCAIQYIHIFFYIVVCIC